MTRIFRETSKNARTEYYYYITVVVVIVAVLCITFRDGPRKGRRGHFFSSPVGNPYCSDDDQDGRRRFIFFTYNSPSPAVVIYTI